MDVDPLGVEIGGRIRAERVARELTGADLAAKLEVPATTITAWELGRVLPGARALLRLGHALGVPAAALLPDPTGIDRLVARIGRLPPSARPDLDRMVARLEQAHGRPG